MSLKVFRNIGMLLSLSGVQKKQGRNLKERDLSFKKDFCMVSYKGEIVWMGKDSQLKSKFIKSYKTKEKEYDFENKTIIPGFVESHTHLIFGGDRRKDFELRNKGLTYEEIAQLGGGIISTLKDTRLMKEKDLLKISQDRVKRFVQQGVTTLEIKSGYALDLKNEIKILKIAAQLKGPRIIRTYLGPHAVPPEFKSSDEYLNFIIKKVLPEIIKSKLADRVDMFIEKSYFSPKQALLFFSEAKKYGLSLTAHTEQLSRTNGYSILKNLDADSVDHLIMLNKKDIEKVAKSNLTAVMLPAADFYLKMKYPPARKLLDAGARLALATDFNPGSCPCQDLSFIGVLARLEMKMTDFEVLSAYTWSAARALGLSESRGSLEVGKSCDFVVLNDSWKSLFYQVGYHPVEQTWRRAKRLRL